MSETCFSFREERRRHQLPGAPREQRDKGSACDRQLQLLPCKGREFTGRRLDQRS
jgi:hypothetical protein